jgi:hypothetical protein
MKSKIHVFVSYSHDNANWLDKTNPFGLLKMWERALDKKANFWIDRDISGGEMWKKKIIREIEKAEVAVLLITEDFVISPFIQEVELPLILRRAAAGECEVLPVLAEPARVERLKLGAVYQISPGMPTPLSEHIEKSDNAWKKARLKVLQDLENTIDRALEKRHRESGETGHTPKRDIDSDAEARPNTERVNTPNVAVQHSELAEEIMAAPLPSPMKTEELYKKVSARNYYGTAVFRDGKQLKYRYFEATNNRFCLYNNASQMSLPDLKVPLFNVKRIIFNELSSDDRRVIRLNVHNYTRVTIEMADGTRHEGITNINGYMIKEEPGRMGDRYYLSYGNIGSMTVNCDLV